MGKKKKRLRLALRKAMLEAKKAALAEIKPTLKEMKEDRQ